jgi:2'-5' RNA ligase
LRAFVALDVPDEQVLDRMVDMQVEMARCGVDVKLVERVNLHFTVRFLGELSESQAKEADRRLRALELRGGEVTLMGVGAFPKETRPNIVWAGVAPKDRETVVQIAEASIKALDGLGQRDERAFQPHITLARVRSGRNKEALSSLIQLNAGRVFGSMRLKEMKLKSSVLTSQGPIYSDIGAYSLK